MSTCVRVHLDGKQSECRMRGGKQRGAGVKTLTSLTANHNRGRGGRKPTKSSGGFSQVICSETPPCSRASRTLAGARRRCVGLQCCIATEVVVSTVAAQPPTPVATLCLTPAFSRACAGEIKEQPNWSLCTASLVHAVLFLSTK